MAYVSDTRYRHNVQVVLEEGGMRLRDDFSGAFQFTVGLRI